MTWEDARDHCRFWFIDLAVISSDQENSHAKSKFYFLLLQLSSSAWIGLRRKPWGWKDGSLSEFRPWAPGEPHTAGGKDVCVRLVPDGFFCANCKDVYPFFCTRGEQWNTRSVCIPHLVSGSVMLPSRAMGKIILSICGLEITSALCSSAFVVVVK